MRKGDDLFFFRAIVALQKKLHIDCIRMTDRNSRLQPAELNIPILSEWIGPYLKIAKMLLHFTHMLTREAGPGVKLTD